MKGLVDLIMSHDAIDRGSLGELFARIYLIVARDAALGGLSFLAGSNTNTHIRPVSLKAFLSSLVNPDNLRPELLKEADDYVLNFTHFARVTKSISSFSSDLLYRSW